MKITQLELSIEWENSGEFEHEAYCDTIDELIRYLKKLKKEQNKTEQEEEWN
jgi:hypothetical protein